MKKLMTDKWLTQSSDVAISERIIAKELYLPDNMADAFKEITEVEKSAYDAELEAWRTAQEEPIIDIESVRERKLAEIADADKESESFSVNGTSMWFDKATRTNLIAEVIPNAIAKGESQVKLWGNGEYFIAGISLAKDLLFALGEYAKITYDIMQQHIVEVNNITDVSELETYDAYKGYPSKLEFKIN